MKLSRKWLNEYVDLSLNECGDRSFAEAMTVSGSKVEVTEDLSKNINNVKVGRIVSIEKHPNSDHMLVCQIDIARPSRSAPAPGTSTWATWCLLPFTSPSFPTERRSPGASSGAWSPTVCSALSRS